MGHTWGSLAAHFLQVFFDLKTLQLKKERRQAVIRRPDSCAEHARPGVSRFPGCTATVSPVHLQALNDNGRVFIAMLDFQYTQVVRAHAVYACCNWIVPHASQ